VLHEGLGDAGVDAVVRHLVADAIGAPAERQLGQVAGPKDDAAALVGGAEEEVGAQAGLDVLEGDVVDLRALAGGVAQVLEHLSCGRADVEFLPRDRQGLHEGDRVGLGALARREAGHREAQDVGARQAEAVARLGSDDERVGGVEAAGDADDDLGRALRVEGFARRAAGDGAQPLLEAADLDVVGLVAVEGEPRLVVGHEGEAVERATQAEVSAGGLKVEFDDPEELTIFGADQFAASVVVERSLTNSFLPQPIQVDVDNC
jgi:hypothetical protein